MNELRLLAGQPIYVENVAVYSPKLIDISLIGEQNYNAFLSLCTLNLNIQDESVDKYDILKGLDQELLDAFYMALEFFTGQTFKKEIYKGEVFIVSENSVLHKNNYFDFVNAVRLANCMPTEKHEELDEFDRRVMEAEKKIREAQSKDKENLSLSDLVSSFCVMENNGLNISNIWDLTIYQFYNQLQRSQLKEKYRLDIQYLIAGAKPEDLDIEHYIKKIDN